MHCSYIFNYNYTSIHVANISEISNISPPSSQHGAHAVKKPGDAAKHSKQELTFFTTLSLSGAWSKRVSKASRSAWTRERHRRQAQGDTVLPHTRPSHRTFSLPRILLIPTRTEGRGLMRRTKGKTLLWFLLTRLLSGKVKSSGSTWVPIPIASEGRMPLFLPHTPWLLADLVVKSDRPTRFVLAATPIQAPSPHPGAAAARCLAGLPPRLRALPMHSPWQTGAPSSVN